MKKPLKDLIVFLILEVGSVIFAAVCFSMISSKVVAGGLAGGFFLIFSLYMLARILRWPKFWESWTLYPLLVFLLGCTIPMLWARFSHLNESFAQVRVWGMPGPEFHHVSSSTLGLLFLITLAETISTIVQKKPGRNNSN